MKIAMAAGSLLFMHALTASAAMPAATLTHSAPVLSGMQAPAVSSLHWWSCIAVGQSGEQSKRVLGFGSSREAAATDALRECKTSAYNQNCTLHSCRFGL